MRNLLFLLILLLPAPALAQGNPTSYIRANVDAVVGILTSPEYAAETNKTEQLRQIEAVVDNFFDSEELSKRSLGQYWRIFTDFPARIKARFACALSCSANHSCASLMSASE